MRVVSSRVASLAFTCFFTSAHGFATSVGSMAKTVLVPISHGSEELESVSVIDTLRRAGAQVTVASVAAEKTVVCSRGVKLEADVLLENLDPGARFDMIALPGGMPGATHLSESKRLSEMIRSHNGEGKYIAAICASPAVVLSPLGLLDGIKATGYPADKFIKEIPNYVRDEDVVEAGTVVTSRGPATALPFALRLVKVLFGDEVSKKIASEMLT